MYAKMIRVRIFF